MPSVSTVNFSTYFSTLCVSFFLMFHQLSSKMIMAKMEVRGSKRPRDLSFAFLLGIGGLGGLATLAGRVVLW